MIKACHERLTQKVAKEGNEGSKLSRAPEAENSKQRDPPCKGPEGGMCQAVRSRRVTRSEFGFRRILVAAEWRRNQRGEERGVTERSRRGLLPYSRREVTVARTNEVAVGEALSRQISGALFKLEQIGFFCWSNEGRERKRGIRDEAKV